MLDLLCFSGEVGWSRIAPVSGGEPRSTAMRPIRSTPIALFRREHEGAWRTLVPLGAAPVGIATLGRDATLVRQCLRERGASFLHEVAAATGLALSDVQRALAELVAGGVVASDGFAGLRAMLSPPRDTTVTARRRPRAMPGGSVGVGGRWSVVVHETGNGSGAVERHEAVELHARALLQRYGVVFRRLLARESTAAAWRELVLAYRRLEARGEIRGGRFVSGMSGEQFATSEAISALRETRRAAPTGELITISAADPLNLVGIVTGGDRIPAIARSRIVFRDGVPLAALEGDYIRPIHEYEPAAAGPVARALAGRSTVPAVTSGFVGRI
jgi:ATP-dependent Lhr-like helicase